MATSEWCEDVYDSEFYSKPDAAGLDPLCTSGSVRQVFRGGSGLGNAWICRSANRGGVVPGLDNWFGLRPALWPLP